jgi:phosphinothricin acetyltransferase
MHARPATPDDAAAIARIYNQGIDDGASTFETRPRTAADVSEWLDGGYPIVVVEDEGAVIAYAATSRYSTRECYRGVAEFAVYVARDHRQHGAGAIALRALYDAARAAGLWKLVSRIFPENTGVRKLNASVGVREVGVHRSHGRLRGQWRDVIVVEWLIVENVT